MRSIKTTLIAILAALAAGRAVAESGDLGAYDDASFSFALSESAGDFGIGARIMSPFLIDVVALSAGADCVWRAGALDSDPATDAWTPYWAFRLGVVAGTLSLERYIRLYGYGGAVLALTSDEVDDDPWGIGGYGGFGFEFLFGNTGKRFGAGYFIELGSNGIGLRAERMPSDPIYLNGFSVATGFRMYL